MKNAPGKLAVAAPADAVRPSFASTLTLPGWLVESVEFANLRLMIERVHTGRIAVLSAARRDRGNRPTSLAFRSYLQSAERLDKDAVEIFAEGKGHLIRGRCPRSF